MWLMELDEENVLLSNGMVRLHAQKNVTSVVGCVTGIWNHVLKEESMTCIPIPGLHSLLHCKSMKIDGKQVAT